MTYSEYAEKHGNGEDVSEWERASHAVEEDSYGADNEEQWDAVKPQMGTMYFAPSQVPRDAHMGDAEEWWEAEEPLDGEPLDWNTQHAESTWMEESQLWDMRSSHAEAEKATEAVSSVGDRVTSIVQSGQSAGTGEATSVHLH